MHTSARCPVPRPVTTALLLGLLSACLAACTDVEDTSDVQWSDVPDGAFPSWDVGGGDAGTDPGEDRGAEPKEEVSPGSPDVRDVDDGGPADAEADGYSEECEPGETRPCGPCDLGTRTCDDDGAWPPDCATDACEPGDSKVSDCPEGEAMRCTTGCVWSACQEPPAECTVEDCEQLGAPDPCKEWSCVDDSCTQSAFEGSCDDGDPCTVGDFCQDGACQAGEPMDCSDLDDTCVEGQCVEGSCEAMPVSGPCDDGDPHTVDDTCDDGVCVGQCEGSEPAGPCELWQSDDEGDCVLASKTGSCDDGDPCTTDDTCADGVCVGTPKDCDDGNPCTSDICEPDGSCGGDAEPDGTPCGDGKTCEAGQCVDGCSLKDCDDGNPCTSDDCAVEDGIAQCVNEPTDQGGACGQDSCGSWGSCDYEGSCAEQGTRSRTCTQQVCDAGQCVSEQTTETESCDRSTQGDSCGSTDCDGWGSCDGFASTCDESGERSRTCTEYTCSGGQCQSDSYTETDSCSRNTDGTSCGSNCGSWSSCGDFSSPCDETGQRTRTCTESVCSGGQCETSSFTETDSCSRDTTGSSCGSTECGEWSSCGGFDSPCDETGQRTRNCIEYSCSGGQCEAESYTESESCSRSTQGDSCGSSNCDGWSSCGGFDSPCDQTGQRSRSCTESVCSGGQCQTDSTTETEPCSRSTQGDSCGSSSCGGWSSCGGFDSPCDETGQRTRSCTESVCSGGQCQSDSYTETDACSRNTDGEACGSEDCSSWSGCAGYSSTCDETGRRVRTCTSFQCSNGSCHGDDEYEQDTCTRNTDGIYCDDDTNCTENDACSNGSCTGSEVTDPEAPANRGFPGKYLGSYDDCDSVDIYTVSTYGSRNWFHAPVSDESFCLLEPTVSFDNYAHESTDVRVCLYYSCDGGACEPLDCPSGTSNQHEPGVSDVLLNGCCLVTGSPSGSFTIEPNTPLTTDDSGELFLRVESQDSDMCTGVDLELEF
ncbi:MAG: hypothetical protein ACQEXJ_20290 [Myxococcota bacterium]